MSKHDDPTNVSREGIEAEPQDSNFVASFPNTRNTRTVRPDSHSSVRDAKGVISTAVASHGGVLTSPPTEDSIVTVGGMTMPVKSALATRGPVMAEHSAHAIRILSRIVIKLIVPLSNCRYLEESSL